MTPALRLSIQFRGGVAFRTQMRVSRSACGDNDICILAFDLNQIHRRRARIIVVCVLIEPWRIK